MLLLSSFESEEMPVATGIVRAGFAAESHDVGELPNKCPSFKALVLRYC